MRSFLLLLYCFLLTFFTCQRQETYTNALADETSPYLLGHAHNPVDWYPWGEEALSKAQSEDKLLLISIGYAACHWCHVMERESFQDTSVANLMNEHFVSIKVDREERPDIDAIYMDACQLATGEACGWPLNVFALPDGRPVWAGTYFQKKNWMEILEYFAKAYEQEPEKMETYASQLLQGIQKLDAFPKTEDQEWTADFAQANLDIIKTAMDSIYGGRIGAPKFPGPNVQELLMQWHYFTEDPQALSLVQTTLDQMARGGIYDQLGGGFSRYSVDNQWKVPHFEKMLYDNGQLVSLYAQAYALTGKKNYAELVRESLSFVDRELTSTEGGFYASLNADSEGEEGKFYTWTQAELEKLLPENEMRRHFFQFYQISPKGNWEHDRNILFRKEELSAYAKRQALDTDQLQSAFMQMETTLRAARAQRIRPSLDDKILTSWNALMMQGYLDAYRYLGDEVYLEKARKNAQFLRDKMLTSEGRLWRSYKGGTTKVNGFLEDYALLAQALLSMYEVTMEEDWLETAKLLVDYCLAHFYDADQKVFYFTSDLDPELITRKTDWVDNVLPGGNSVMAEVLYDLSRLYYHSAYQEIAFSMLANAAAQLETETSPLFYSNWLQLYLRLVYDSYEVAVVGPDYTALHQQLLQEYLPNALFLGGQDEGSLPLLEDKLQDGQTFIYVCQDRFCKLPVQEVEAALDQLQ